MCDIERLTLLHNKVVEINFNKIHKLIHKGMNSQTIILSRTVFKNIDKIQKSILIG